MQEDGTRGESHSDDSFPGGGDQQPPGNTNPWMPATGGYDSWGDPGSGAGGYGPPGGYGSWGDPAAGPGGYGRAPRRRRGRRLAYLLGTVLAAGIGAGITAALNHGHGTASTGISAGDVPRPHDSVARSESGGHDWRAVASKVDPGVVDINAAVSYSGGTTSEGTGMVIDPGGLVLTNNHVIEQASRIEVTLAISGKRYTARVVGYDTSEDVALLQLAGASGLTAVSVGNSSQVTLGTPVLAFGNAEGEGGRPATAYGVINSLNRTITPTDEGTGTTEILHGMLQTNANIVPGDSGGPLANAAGQVIGMDTANASASQGTPAVLGYAIPINRVLSIAAQIAAGHGTSAIQIGVPGFLGVLVPKGTTSTNPRQQEAQQQQQEEQQGGGSYASPGSGPGPGGPGYGGMGCVSEDMGATTPLPSAVAPASRGVLVDGTLCGTPAASAGLAGGDVITAVDGHAVTSPGALTEIIARYRPGTRVTIRWVSTSGRRHASLLTLAAAPAR